jgi:hypothetical protein
VAKGHDSNIERDGDYHAEVLVGNGSRQQRSWPLLLAGTGTNTKQLILTPEPNRPGSSCHRAPL